jgi:DNA modification methylase
MDFLHRHWLIFTLISSSGGTNGVVALDLGRRFVGYEIKGDFCNMLPNSFFDVAKII